MHCQLCTTVSCAHMHCQLCTTVSCVRFGSAIRLSRYIQNSPLHHLPALSFRPYNSMCIRFDTADSRTYLTVAGTRTPPVQPTQRKRTPPVQPTQQKRPLPCWKKPLYKRSWKMSPRERARRCSKDHTQDRDRAQASSRNAAYRAKASVRRQPCNSRKGQQATPPAERPGHWANPPWASTLRSPHLTAARRTPRHRIRGRLVQARTLTLPCRDRRHPRRRRSFTGTGVTLDAAVALRDDVAVLNADDTLQESAPS